jgi:hypothetical protein
LNEGHGYNKTTGYFTAPVTGVYQFTAHTCNYFNKAIIVEIVHNGKVIAVTTNWDNYRNTCSSVSALAMVAAGDLVSIKSAHGDGHMVANHHRWPSFNGVLLNVF